MTIVERIACMTLGHQYGIYRKIIRQWRKQATCDRCGKVSTKLLTAEERKVYEEREARTIRRQAKEQRQANRSSAQAHEKPHQTTRQTVRDINAASDPGTEDGTPPAAA